MVVASHAAAGRFAATRPAGGVATSLQAVAALAAPAINSSPRFGCARAYLSRRGVLAVQCCEVDLMHLLAVLPGAGSMIVKASAMTSRWQSREVHDVEAGLLRRPLQK